MNDSHRIFIFLTFTDIGVFVMIETMIFVRSIPDFILMFGIYIYLVRKQKITSVSQKLFYLYLCFMIMVTLCPVVYQLPHLFAGHYTKYNFDPFVDLLNGYGSPLQECIENVILFVPFTYLYRSITKHSLCKSACVGLLISICIEVFQPLISDIRVCDITDMITNGFGALLGSWLYSLLHKNTTTNKLPKE